MNKTKYDAEIDQQRTNFWQELFELILGVSVIFVTPFFLSGGTLQEIILLAAVVGVCASPFAGPWFIRRVVRILNRRDDPRCQRPPTTPP